MLYSVIICIAYIIGIVGGLYLELNLGIVSLFLCICVLSCTVICIVLRKIAGEASFKTKQLLAIILAIILLGFVNTKFRMNDFKTKYTQDIIYTKGEVLKLISEGDYYNKYIFKNEENNKFLLYVKNDNKLEQNSIINLKGRFEIPDEARNRGGFDYSKYMYSQNLYGSIFIEKFDDIEILETGRFNLITLIQNSIFEILAKLLPKDQLGILLGMLIGDTFYISEEISEAFRQSGITHLLAVSGSNVTYIILVTKFLFQKIFRQKYLKLYNNYYGYNVCATFRSKSISSSSRLNGYNFNLFRNSGA